MKKLALLLTTALALTACTAAPEVSSPAETALPAETETTGEAAFPVGTLQMAIPQVMDTGTASVEITFTGLETEPILKLDYAAGVQTKLCDIDLSRQIPVAIMQHGDTVEYFWDSEGGTVFAHTAIRPDGSVEEQTIPEKFYPNFYDEYAAYDIWGTTCTRLDWQTGELTTASLPFVQLDSVLGAVGSRVLLTRIVSDTPLPQGEGNEEMQDAVLQNSLREYDLYDPASNSRTTPRTTTRANRIWATAATSCILGSPTRTARPRSARRTRWSAMTAPRAPGRRNAAPTPRAGSTAASGRFPLTGSSSWWCCGAERTP